MCMHDLFIILFFLDTIYIVLDFDEYQKADGIVKNVQCVVHVVFLILDLVILSGFTR